MSRWCQAPAGTSSLSIQWSSFLKPSARMLPWVLHEPAFMLLQRQHGSATRAPWQRGGRCGPSAAAGGGTANALPPRAPPPEAQQIPLGLSRLNHSAISWQHKTHATRPAVQSCRARLCQPICMRRSTPGAPPERPQSAAGAPPERRKPGSWPRGLTRARAPSSTRAWGFCSPWHQRTHGMPDSSACLLASQPSSPPA